MFQLEREVRAWCASILPGDFAQDENLAELADHLTSAIEDLQETGLTEEQAFATATRRMGETKMLMTEYSKNRSFVSRLCELDRKLSGTGTITDPKLRKLANRLILGHAVLWAAALIAATVLLEDAENAHTWSTLVMVPLWFASFLLITGSFRSLRRED